MSNFDPNKNHIFYYTMNCAICGKAVLDDNDKFRKIIKDYGYEFEIREVPLYHGWKAEVSNIGEEPPFFYNYDTQTVAKYSDIIREYEDKYVEITENANGDISVSKSTMMKHDLLEQNLKELLKRNA